MESIKELKEICQKPIKRKDTNVVLTFTCRPFSIFITKLCLLLGINANQVTIFFNVLIVLTGVLFMFGKYWYTLAAVLILQLAFILDCVDGEIARYDKVSSVNGKYLDSVLHYVIYPFVIFGLSFGVYRHFGDVRILVLGFFAGVFFTLVDVVRMARYDIVFSLINKSSKSGTFFREQKVEKTVLEQPIFIKKGFYFFNLLFRMTGFLYIMLIAAIFNLIYVQLGLLIAYAAVLPVVTLTRIYYEYKKGLERFIPYLKLK